MHMHHIIQKYRGGTDDPENLVEVTVEEHALIHENLYHLYGRQEDYIAWKALSGQIDRYELNRLRAKLPKSEAHKQALRKPHKKFSDKTREKMRLYHLGKPSPSKGKTWVRKNNPPTWNKGLTMADPRVARNVAKMAATRYGGK